MLNTIKANIKEAYSKHNISVCSSFLNSMTATIESKANEKHFNNMFEKELTVKLGEIEVNTELDKDLADNIKEIVYTTVRVLKYENTKVYSKFSRSFSMDISNNSITFKDSNDEIGMISITKFLSKYKKYTDMSEEYNEYHLKNTIDRYSLYLSNSAINKFEVMISIDPYEFISCSEDSLFSSCFAIKQKVQQTKHTYKLEDGANHLMTNVYARSNNTFVVFAKNEMGLKIFRKIGIISEDVIKLYLTYCSTSTALLDIKLTSLIVTKLLNTKEFKNVNQNTIENVSNFYQYEDSSAKCYTSVSNNSSKTIVVNFDNQLNFLDNQEVDALSLTEIYAIDCSNIKDDNVQCEKCGHYHIENLHKDTDEAWYCIDCILKDAAGEFLNIDLLNILKTDKEMLKYTIDFINDTKDFNLKNFNDLSIYVEENIEEDYRSLSRLLEYAYKY